MRVVIKCNKNKQKKNKTERKKTENIKEKMKKNEKKTIEVFYTEKAIKIFGKIFNLKNKNYYILKNE